jgi:hypothetical protein
MMMDTLTCNRCDKEVVDCACPDVEERLAKVQSGYAGRLARKVEAERAVKRASAIKPEPENN